MSKEKQIKETTELLWHFPKALHLNCYNDCLEVAKLLYEENYHKQSKGKWIDQYNGKYDNPIYVCSLCRKGTLLTPEIDILGNMGMIQALSPFCPNCGAKMRKEDEGK